VTYALHFAGNPFETPGPGLGFVDIYSSKGKLLRRLEHGDWLNAPWGVTLAPLDFGKFSHRLLVSNFSAGGTTQSAGFISAYDLDKGKFEGVRDVGKRSDQWHLVDQLCQRDAPNSYDPDGSGIGAVLLRPAPTKAPALRIPDPGRNRPGAGKPTVTIA
jgi:hypothetical protein